MTKKIVLSILALLLVLGILAGIKAMQIRSMIAMGESMTPPPETVTTAVASLETWQPKLAAVGSIAAVQGVTLASEEAGTVKEISFESGSMVEKGALLVQLDVDSELAQLRSAEADAQLARLDLERAHDLLKQKAIAKSEWDAAEAKQKRSDAQVQNIQALIAKKTLKAPFSGQLGIREINIGEVLQKGQKVVPLQALDPVYVNFSLPEQHIAHLETGMVVEVTTDAFPTQVFKGRLTAINPDLDAATRSVRLQATLENPQHQLRPGMFAKVSLVLPNAEEVLIVPATGVAYAPYGNSVFVVSEKSDEKTGKVHKVVEQRLVRLGETRGDFVAITSGLKAGETVVGTGVFKLRNGMEIAVENALAPKASTAPTPENK